MHPSRRGFLRSTSGAGAAFAMAFLNEDWLQRVRAADKDQAGPSPKDAGGNESFWFQIQQAFTVDRSIINLNNGGVSPSPRIVQDAFRRHYEFANQAPSRNLWLVQDPQVELVRTELAKTFGCDPEEMAITRNASESLENAINGIDLKRGDEILTTTHDYPRMITTIQQRGRREGVVLRQVKPPLPPKSLDELVVLFEQAITPKTKAILVSHIVNITGQIFPVKAIVKMARAHGIRTIVDGAHAFAHFQYTYADLDCDYYGVSLHKWLTAPHGSGFLFVRRERIADLWPLMAAPDTMNDNIRKFEEIGTHAAANRLAIAEALMFFHGIGAERKEARLRFLRDRWARRLMTNDRIRLHTNLDPDHSCGIGTVQIDGIDSRKVCDYLWDKHKIIATAIAHPEFEGVRVTPNVYTTLPEIDLFCEAMETLLRKGLPAA